MEYNWRYSNALSGVFRNFGNIMSGDVRYRETTLDNHNAFNKLFVIDISSDEIEVPTFARSAVESVVKDKLKFPSKSVNKIVIPMYMNTAPYLGRVADSIVRELFKTDFNQRLKKITTSKGEIYYGGKGIILDKDFNILLLCTLICKKVERWGEQVMSYYKPIIHVNPQVFLKSESLIEKSILKRIIPFYLLNGIGYVTSGAYFTTDFPEETKPQIVIDDVSKFIENPVKPTPQKCSDNILNQILVDNADDVLNYF